jgi:colicin import membrane protein
MEPNPPVPMVRFSLNPDATLASQPTVVNSSPHPLFRVAADSATRAVRQCRLRIPAQFQPYYQDWKDLAVNFNPRDMI